MAKKKVKLKDLGKQHIKDSLYRVHPFLSGKERKISFEETTSTDVLKEIYPQHENDPADALKYSLYKLRALYALQN